MKHFDFDIIVIGGGHAGIEAALAASRMNKSVGLITIDKSKLALMSCNPAIGGLGKSHIVKEIDALGGVMGIAIDATGIQFRRLNLSRGPAVWSTRAQADRIAYNRFICEYMEKDRKVSLIEAIAGKFLIENEDIVGIETEDGEKILARAVIVCSGTFLAGLIHIGEKQFPAGRRGEKAAYKLSDSFRSLGFEVGRLKTGTPPRLDAKTIDFDRCKIQPGDIPIPYFSYTTVRDGFEQSPCHLTYTTEKTREVVSRNLYRSPIFSGQIKSCGPRYCPSIEDKIYRFRDKPRHQIFLEPEGNDTDEIYPNGFSTSLPEEVQKEAIRTVIGLEQVEITEPGYAVEYDYCPAYQVKANLETKRVKGLFLAGQINGTSGYEEAGGQGIMAGINAVLMMEREPPFILNRAQAYIGVMVDDLITHSTTEPYRMFTSRAEYRLELREDNARDRLFPHSKKYGLVPDEHHKDFEKLQQNTENFIQLLKSTSVPLSKLDGIAEYFGNREKIVLADIFKIPSLELEKIQPYLDIFIPPISPIDKTLERAAIFIKYEGYIRKQRREIDKFKKMENKIIPDYISFADMAGLRNEAKEKFQRLKPTSLGQAGRIEGITTGDLTVLSIYIKKYQSQRISPQKTSN
ncbi:MAG: tRNA uridine-5-carboxymethylaminomethyl(34) synthesis enzyme MnmG [candidate division Zixibacteria bacterium]|nr:tRNA uridine-5-carboxymethylaminomethyl(34) synthesis enzyme MnmG [candidate division Zixibacteria bacterium]